MIPCNRPGCAGVVEETGFCDTCYMHPLPATPSPAPSVRRTQVSVGTDLLSLPVFEFPDPSSRILSNPEVPERSRRCANCDAEVGTSYAGQPPVSEGFCQQCRHPYSFLPNLHEGDLVAGQYKVVGCFARGGLGWIYLARDAHLDDNLVVLKGLIDTSDAALAAAERRALTTMDHQNIVRIFNFVTHPDARTGQEREYIVMEYVDGLVLSEVKEQSMLGREPLGEPLRVEHVIACGLQILAAFEYLHGRNLLYCDMKPENVIVRPGRHGERENRIKIIDLGAVRKAGDRTSRIIGTRGYHVGQPEIDERGLTVQSDVYTLGETLERLLHATVDWTEQHGVHAGGSRIAVGLESFRRVRARATNANPDRRFASAAQMSEQLKGVQREIASLRDGVARPEPSTVFIPTAVLLDGGLGAVPPLDRWTHRFAETGAPLADDGRPAPAAVAVGLPAPQVDPGDAAAGFLGAADAPEPHRLLDKLSASGYESAEVRFARCRAHLELGDLGSAAESLRRVHRAEEWRLAWHRGLLALARGEVEVAESEFDAVYDAVPGEDAPKLALGFCSEYRRKSEQADRLYEAVWRRDRSQGSAAFGLTRIRLSHGDRAGAVAVLDEVPKVSRHYDAATIAAVIILSGQLSSGPPSADDLRVAAERLPALYLDGGDRGGDARDRMTAIVREAAFGDAPDIEKRVLLEESYRALARQARDADGHGVLIDLANTIRPWTFR